MSEQHPLAKIELDWKSIDTVLLDMDGTLLDLHFDNHFWLEFLPRHLSKVKNESMEDCQSYLQQMSNEVKGTLDWYCLDYWSQRLDLDIPKLKQRVSHKIAFRPNTIPFLQSLNERNKTVILATNAHPLTLELKLLKADFSEYFDNMSSSHELGFPKEVPEYWAALMDRYSLTASKCLFIDDSQAVLKAANDFGVAHILAIEQPDSTKKSVDCSPYTGIRNFSQLI